MEEAGRRFKDAFKRSKRALAVGDAIQGLVPALIVSGIFAFGIAVASLLLGGPVQVGWWAAAILAGLIALGIDLARHGWSDIRVAQRLDAAEGAASRYSTGLTLLHRTRLTPLEQLALEECGATLSAHPEMVPTRACRRPFVVFGTIVWLVGLGLFGVSGYIESSRPDGDGIAEALDRAADELAEAEIPFAAPENLAALQKGLREEAERLRSGASNDPERDGMRALSRAGLEIQKASAKAGGGGLKDSELDALEDAAGRQPSGEGLEAALDSGDLSAASERASEMPPQEARSAALEAASRQQGEASELMQHLAQEAGAGSDASKLLSDALQQSEEARKQSRQLAKLQSALSDMKMDMRPSQQPGQQSLSEEDQQRMLAAMQQQQAQQGGGEDPGQQAGLESSMPTGQPGSEKDTGTTLDPFGKADDIPPTDLLSFLRGERAAGPVESSSAATDNMDAEVLAQWREVQAAAEQAAAESVRNESIPPGARRLVIRYFEELRPQE